MQYKNYTVEDFAMDAHFQEWVQHPTERTDLYWKKWLLENPLQADTVAEARELVQAMSEELKPMPAHKAEAIWHALEAAAIEEGAQAQAPDIAGKAFLRPSVSPGYYFTRIAASFAGVVLLTAALLAYHYLAGTVHHTTAYGETKKILLPDSSVVVLNANSTLSFSKRSFVGLWPGKEVREVWLSGEAFFSVVHTVNHHKFIVHTDDFLQVEVLGTEFNITRRKNKTRVVLENGQIKLSIPSSAKIATQEQSLLMKPGELVEFDEKADRYIRKKVNPEVYSSWKSNKWLLDNTSLQEIIQLLENSYGFAIAVSDQALLTQKVSGSIPLGDKDVLLQYIAQTFEIRISRTGNNVAIHPLKSK
jgi:ferric-dicitrate binding protein FerR (iron transport regulator)